MVFFQQSYGSVFDQSHPSSNGVASLLSQQLSKCIAPRTLHSSVQPSFSRKYFDLVSFCGDLKDILGALGVGIASASVVVVSGLISGVGERLRSSQGLDRPEAGFGAENRARVGNRS